MPAVPPLLAHANLNTSAQAHANDMVKNNFFSHTGSDGKQPWDRMTRAGYAWKAAGENIAAGNSTVDTTMTQWLNSPGHCANLMNSSFTQMGLACVKGTSSNPYGTYWTQDLAKPR